MPGSALRVALAFGVLAVAGCRTKDNPAVCDSNDPGDCSPGFRCERLLQMCVPITDGGPRTDGPGAEAGNPGDGSPGPGDGAVDTAGCRGPDDCSGDRGVCSAGRCVACVAHADCKADPLRPVCASDNTCVGCGLAGATACMDKNPATPFCAREGGCAECKTSVDCKQPTAPACVAGKCVPCTADSQCAEHGANPGLCLGHMGGRCAADADVIYVQSVQQAPNCVRNVNGPGSVEMPFCNPQHALETIMPGSPRRVLLLRGEAALGPIDVPADFTGIAGGVISIIGQHKAEIAPGAFPGVAVRGGDVFIRSLTIRMGELEGVVAEGAATVRIHQTVIRSNKKGGLRAEGGAGFEVVNSVFDQNGPGSVSNGLIPFGGAFLGPADQGRPEIFRFNTVIRNFEVGVACGKPSAPMQELGSVLLWGNMGGTAMPERRNCRTTHSQEGPDDPRFEPGRPYHLSKESPCVDKGDPESFPPEDWEGQRRPAGARADCGADEFHPE